MAIFNRENIRQLLEPQEPPCVTMTFPVIKAGADSLQNAVRFKNSLHIHSNYLKQVFENLRDIWHTLCTKIICRAMSAKHCPTVIANALCPDMQSAPRYSAK